MNRNRTHKRLNYLSIGMIFCALILFSGIGVVANVLSTHAAPFIAADSTPTAGTAVFTPKDTPTPPTPTNTPIPPTPTNTPIPPTPTNTPIPPTSGPQPTPTRILVPPAPADNATATATSTPTTTSTATATSTAVTTLTTGKDDHSAHHITNTQPDYPNLPGDNTGGSNILALSLGIATPLLFLFGGGLFWLYLRKNHAGAVAFQKQNILATSRNARQKGNNDAINQNAFVPAPNTFSATTLPMPTTMPYAPTPMPYAPTPKVDNIPTTNTLQQPISPPPAEPVGSPYTPSDLRPMTMTFPAPATNQPGANPMPYGPTSDMSPLSFDAFNLPHKTAKAVEPEQTLDQPVPAITPANQEFMMEDTARIATHPPQSNSASATPATLSVQPPDVADDPILESVMRQAQLGLFVAPGHENS